LQQLIGNKDRVCNSSMRKLLSTHRAGNNDQVYKLAIDVIA